MKKTDYSIYRYLLINYGWPWVIVERQTYDPAKPGYAPLKFWKKDRTIKMKQVTFDKDYVYDESFGSVKYYVHK